MIPEEYQDKVFDRMALLPIDGAIDLNAEKESTYLRKSFCGFVLLGAGDPGPRSEVLESYKNT